MRGYVERTWGRFDEQANRRNIAATIAAGNYAVVERDGEDAGVLSVERKPGFLWLAQLFILPEHQNRGIGTRVVRELIAEAAAARISRHARAAAGASRCSRPDSPTSATTSSSASGGKARKRAAIISGVMRHSPRSERTPGGHSPAGACSRPAGVHSM